MVFWRDVDTVIPPCDRRPAPLFMLNKQIEAHKNLGEWTWIKKTALVVGARFGSVITTIEIVSLKKNIYGDDAWWNVGPMQQHLVKPGGFPSLAGRGWVTAQKA